MFISLLYSKPLSGFPHTRLLLFSRSVVSDSATPWTAVLQASPSFTVSQSLLKLMPIEPVMPSNHLILCHPLVLLPSIFPSIRVFQNESALYIRWPKYWSFSFNISSSNEHPGLISFRMDWLDLGSPQTTISPLSNLNHLSSQAVVLEKTLESPLDCKEIQPVHSKGDQSWVSIGRTDAKAETPILWPPHVKS